MCRHMLDMSTYRLYIHIYIYKTVYEQKSETKNLRNEKVASTDLLDWPS